MRNLFILSILSIFLIMLSSCEKEDAHAIQCVGDSCQQTIDYPACQDDYYLIISDDPEISPIYCPNGCLNGQCIPDSPECTSGMTQCISDLWLQTCVDGFWNISECKDLCENGACIDQPTCIDGERRCSDSNIEICTNGQWVLYEICPVDCRDGECTSCDEGDLRCSKSNIEVCIDGAWTIQEICPYGCQDGSCSESCSGEDYCQDSSTLMQCVGNEWIAVSCKNGCSSGECKPDVTEEVDHRLTNKLCREDEDGDPDICNHDYRTNELGGVCVDAGPYAYFCFARCDPNEPTHNYYCMDESFAAIQGDCRQISDGSYAIIPTHVDICLYSGCSPKNGCTSITESYEVHPSYCDNYENYCEGTIVHECTYQMETYDCREYGDEVCVQFWSNIYCASPCKVEGEVYYECSPGYDTMYSTSVTCVPDDNGVLSWQYNYGVINECPNGCDATTGLCK